MSQNDFNRIEGKGNIWAEVVADSINPWGDRITSFRLHYHRFIHAEFLRHRMFSNSVSSSRAIPVPKMMEQVQDNPATPIFWGKNQAGMKADVEVENTKESQEAWQMGATRSVESAKLMHSLDMHKQVANRVLEPFQFINQVVTATDYENFYFLRIHGDAQPEIQELANVMFEAKEQSTPVLMREGWHMPFIDEEMVDKFGIEDCKKISASVCAQSSYRLADASLEKAEAIYDKLVTSRPLHASPFEHIAQPFTEAEMMARMDAQSFLETELLRIYKDLELVQNMTRHILYNGNFRGWNQMRKQIPDENFLKTFVKSS